MTAVDLPPWLLRPTTSRYQLPPTATPITTLTPPSDTVSSPSCPTLSAVVPAIVSLETAEPLCQFKPLCRAHSLNAPHLPSSSSSCLLHADILELTDPFMARLDKRIASFEACITAKLAQLEQQPSSKLCTLIPCQPHSFSPQSSHGCATSLKSTSKANVPCKRPYSDLSIQDHGPSFILDLLLPPGSSPRAYNHNFAASSRSSQCAYLFPQHAHSHPIPMRQSFIQICKKFCGQYLHHYQDVLKDRANAIQEAAYWYNNRHKVPCTDQIHFQQNFLDRCTYTKKQVRLWLQKIPDLYEYNARGHYMMSLHKH